MDPVLVKLATNVCIAPFIFLPKDGLAVVAVPDFPQCVLFCNSDETANTLCDLIDGAKKEKFVTRIVVKFELACTYDFFVEKLHTLLESCGLSIAEESEERWNIR